MRVVHRALALLLLLPAAASVDGHRLRTENALILVENPANVEREACNAADGDDCSQRNLAQTTPLAVAEERPPEFVPTHEWQDILPNQAIPPGLYIRVNLQTGRKEAKLLD